MQCIKQIGDDMKKILCLLVVAILTGCATSDGATRKIPSIECKGKGVITGTGNVVVMMGSASNNFTLQADCGEHGFMFRQYAPEEVIK